MLTTRTLISTVAVMLVLFSSCTKANAPTSQTFEVSIERFIKNNPDKFSIYSEPFPFAVKPEFQKVSCADSLPKSNDKQVFFHPCNFNPNKFHQLENIGFYTKDPTSQYFILTRKRQSDRCAPHILNGQEVAFATIFSGDCSVRSRVIGSYIFDRILETNLHVHQDGKRTAIMTVLFKEDSLANDQLARILQIDPYYRASPRVSIRIIETNDGWVVDGKNFKI